MNDLSCLLHHRHLVLTSRNHVCLEGCDIGSLTDRIGKEANRDAGLKVSHLDLTLYGWVSLQSGNRNDVHKVSGHLIKLRHHGLDKDRGFFRIKTCRQVIERNLQNILADLLRVIRIVCERLGVSDHDIDIAVLAGILKLYSSSKRSYIMSYMKTTCRTVSC